MTSIFHCEQCGGLLASRGELTEGMCLACQFDRDWQSMQQARRAVVQAVRRDAKSQQAGDGDECEQTVTEPGQRGV